MPRMYCSSAPMSLRSSTCAHTAVRQRGSACAASAAEHLRASRNILTPGSSSMSCFLMTAAAS